MIAVVGALVLLLEARGAAAAPQQPREGTPQELALSEFVRLDPDKIVGAERCGECHYAEHRVWSETPHATGFDTLHRRESAEQIAAAMGFRLIKRVSLCLKCHYTPEVVREQLRALEGVSCESCHGAARDWVDVHADYGVANADLRVARSEETPQHREQRIAASRANGMRRPSDLYGVAANCFQCHTVPHEELVNVGGHSTGSGAFELVEWSQGEMRHDFLESFLGGDGTLNAESPPARKRIMYVVGRALDLEYLLRDVALASGEGKYLSSLTRRKRRVVGALQEIGETARVPEVDRMLALVADVDLRPGNAAPLEAAADQLRELTRSFIAHHDGEQLAALDPLYRAAPATGEAEAELPGESAPGEGTGDDAAREPPGIDDPAAATTPAAGASTAVAGEPPAVGSEPPAAAAGDTTGLPGAAGRGTAASAEPAGATDPAGAILTWPPWRPRPRHATLREVPCTSCHEHSNHVDWWYGDAHATAADPLLDGDPDYLRMAVAYGIGAEGMSRGDQLCMQCHGTYATGRETRAVNDGVGCQRCHGPGADYKDVHQQDRPAALNLGMVALDDPLVRAATCGGCHYVTDPRLISVGHPTGAAFDFVAANAKIKHWETDAAPEALHAAFDSVIVQRGPLPSVAVIAPLAAAAGTADAATQTDARSAEPGAAAGQPATPGTGGAARATVATQRQRANLGADSGSAAEVPGAPTGPAGATTTPDELPALALPANASAEEILLLVRQRLELLHRLLAGGR